MKRSNVVKFPTGSSGSSSGNSLKLFAVVFYLLLAFLLTFGLSVGMGGFQVTPLQISDEGLSLLILLGMLYNFFVRAQLQKTRYFQDNKPLIIILAVLLAIVFKATAIVIAALAGLYWFMVSRSGKEAPYFLRFHLLTGLMLNFFILMPYLILGSVLGLGLAILKVAHLTRELSLILAPIQYAFPLLATGIFWAAAVWLSISALMGRTPYIPVVTNNVRHWA